MDAEFSALGCRQCREGQGFETGFTMAFQPIVDAGTCSIFGYEALVRGLNNEGAGTILSQVTAHNRYAFDQACRVKAIDLAARLGLQGMLSINFLPKAVYRPETCIRATLEAARENNFPTDRLMFEVTEGEEVEDHNHLLGIFAEYKRQKFRTAIDDFGAGYSGLNLLANFQPDFIKLDMALTRNINADRARRAIVSAVLSACRELSVKVIAEGIETREEFLTLWDAGVRLFQGYLFAKPGFQTLPELPKNTWEMLRPRRVADRRAQFS